MNIRKAICNLALKLQGTPYIWGGSSPQGGFDCSGFVVWVLQVFDILPSGDWSAHDLFVRFGALREFQKTFFDTGKPGDLVFYGKELHVNHVGILLDESSLSASIILCSGGDHTTTTFEEAKRRNAFVKVKNVKYRLDFLGYGHLPIEEE